MFGFVRGVRGRAVVVVLVVAGLLAGVTAGSVAAGPSTTVTWKVSSLTAGQVKSLSNVATTNSSGVKTWSKTGSCVLSPKSQPTTLTMGTGASCTLTLKIAKTSKYPAKTSTTTITRKSSTTTTVARTTTTVAPTTTTVAPTTTTVAPTTTTTVALTCATGGSCAVGDTGPGGGIVFYVASEYFTSTGSDCGTQCKYLEVAPTGWIKANTPSGQTNCREPGTEVSDPKCEWSDIEVLIGTTGTDIGTGYANTSAIIAQSNVVGQAATVARAFQGGGKTDWFLPSKDELNALCKWAYNDNVNLVCNNDGVNGTFSLVNGGFSSYRYWSSSELSNSWGQWHNFEAGIQGFDSKGAKYYVRPVRAF